MVTVRDLSGDIVGLDQNSEADRNLDGLARSNHQNLKIQISIGKK
jgi:hypothetical protein